MTEQQHESGNQDVQSDFESWAAVSVRLVKRADQEVATILAELGLTQRWAAADHTWSKALCDDIQNGRLQRVNRYGELCAAELASRRDQGPASQEEQPQPPVSGQSQSFAANMGAQDPAPRPPEPGQDATVAADELSAIQQSLAAAKAAEGWSIERYAHLCAELQQYPDRLDAIYDRYGLQQPEVRKHVMDSWNERLAADAQLYAQWQALVSQVRGGLSRGH